MITKLIHEFLDWGFTISSFTLIPIVSVLTGYYYCIVLGPLLFLVYPIILELGLNVYGYLTYSKSSELETYRGKKKEMVSCLGIIYAPGYKMTACGFEKLHPFDSIKH